MARKPKVKCGDVFDFNDDETAKAMSDVPAPDGRSSPLDEALANIPPISNVAGRQHLVTIIANYILLSYRTNEIYLKLKPYVERNGDTFSRTTMNNYMQSAKVQISSDLKQSRQGMLDIITMQTQEILKQAFQRKDLKLALEATKEIAKLYDLYAPERREQTIKIVAVKYDEEL